MHEQQPNYHNRRNAQTALALLSTAALTGVATVGTTEAHARGSVMGAPSAETVAAANDTTYPNAYERTLPLPTELAGSTITIGNAERSLLASASVKIVRNYPAGSEVSYPGNANGTCTGVKIKEGQHTYISTAAHCFAELTDAPRGLLDPAAFGGKSALDFINRANSSYTIQDTSLLPSKRTDVATATAVSVATGDTDSALLAVTPSNQPSTQRTYKQIGRINNAATASFIPGQEVGLYGAPQSNLDKRIQTTGRYLGRMPLRASQNGKDMSTTMDFVAINPRRPYEDACHFGASGSSFIAKQVSGRSATGKLRFKKPAISGPLSIRINTLYDPYDSRIGPSARNEKERLIHKLGGTNILRKQMESTLNVRIDPDSTLCGFSVQDRFMRSNMVAAIGNYAPLPSAPAEQGYK